jgi:adenylosuccinate synthase
MKTICKTGKKSQVCAILGSQWGDEGKGKLTDFLAGGYDICARFNGGNNAGHTVIANGKKYAFHILPSGILSEKTINVLGNGVVINLRSLQTELLNITNSGIKPNLLVSDRAHIIFNAHIESDKNQEIAAGDGRGFIGTTKKGIGPSYSTKARRTGLRIGDLLHMESFQSKYDYLHKTLGFDPNTPECKQELEEIKQFGSYLKEKKLIGDSVQLVNEAYNNKKRILCEGANAPMLDIDFGSYPYVTSSSTSVGGIMTGLGLNHQKLETVIGVTRAYMIRVGEGPFPTECLEDEQEVAHHLREEGHEYGTTTGRPRRIGWFDTQIVKFTNVINGYTSLNFTKVDVLSKQKSLKLGIGYKYKNGGKYTGLFPATLEELAQLEPIYEILPGWECDISNITEYDKLPTNCKRYIERIEELVGVPISWVGTGRERTQLVLKEDRI